MATKQQATYSLLANYNYLSISWHVPAGPLLPLQSIGLFCHHNETFHDFHRLCSDREGSTSE